MVKTTHVITSNAERCKKYREKQKLAKDQIEKNLDNRVKTINRQPKTEKKEEVKKPNLMNDEQGVEPSAQLRPQYEGESFDPYHNNVFGTGINPDANKPKKSNQEVLRSIFGNDRTQ